MACLTLGEALYGATATRQVIAEAARSPRMTADEESLAPLVDCLERANAASAERWSSAWPDAALRSLANGYGAALVGSRLPRDEIRTRLAWLEHDSGVPADVARLWRARLPGTPLAAQAAELRRALELNPDNPAASLALALVLVEQGGAAEAEALRDKTPDDMRPDLHAVISAAALLARGERHQASALLERVARDGLPDTAPNGPDALALRLLPAPSSAPLLCAAGRSHEEAGERTDALRVYRAGGCFAEVTSLYLDEGDTFSALLASLQAPAEVRERAFTAASAHGLLEQHLAATLGTCERLGGGARCAAHRAKLEGARSLVPGSRGDAAVSAERDEIIRRALGLLFLDNEDALLHARPLEGDAEVLYVVRGSERALIDRPETGVVERALLSPGLIPSTGIEPDYDDGLQVEILDVIEDGRGGRALVHALQVGDDEAAGGPLARRRGGLALVEETAQGWRARRVPAHFPSPMALSPAGP